MSLSIEEVGPAIMYGGLALVMGYGTYVQKEPSWIFPAMICAGFLGFTVATIVKEGFLAVIPALTSNFWSNQVWYDLLFAVGLFWFALVERAKKVGMPLLPWFIYVVSAASIGGLNMYARILYLEEQQGKGDDALLNVNDGPL
ncbi:unnamed protein product [Cylindrotheca closterium]|uniref:Uncharacterized protein n=1 Tax=Cylindrotheca closterium TaxID=2856 RepID=A0AAD2FZ46_9STRA|nr:unnamed protein product [Cylindrotheca closterium]